MRKVLITGSSGFLGSILANELSVNNTVICLSRRSGKYKVSLEQEIPKFEQPFNLVIHAAGKAHSIPKNQLEQNQFYDINVKGTKNLLEGLALVGFSEQFVFISSVSVYGMESGDNINEDYILSAKDAYGLSKIQAEKLVMDWCKENNVICTILRLPLIVGVNPPGNLGSMLHAIKKGYYFNIGGGIAKKSMVLAQDVARFIPQVSKIGGVYNLTDGVHPTFNELSKAIAKNDVFNLPLILAKFVGLMGDLIGKRSPLNTLKLKKINSNLTFDDNKAREIGWKPQSVLSYLNFNDL